MGKGYFDIPVNLPHAGTIASRLVYHVERQEQTRKKEFAEALRCAEILEELLATYRFSGENPAEDESRHIVSAAADQARQFVDQVERLQCGDDRLGQSVRNLFECLGLGREGTMQSLRAGENPDSTLRPA